MDTKAILEFVALVVGPPTILCLSYIFPIKSLKAWSRDRSANKPVGPSVAWLIGQAMVIFLGAQIVQLYLTFASAHGFFWPFLAGGIALNATILMMDWLHKKL